MAGGEGVGGGRGGWIGVGRGWTGRGAENEWEQYGERGEECEANVV